MGKGPEGKAADSLLKLQLGFSPTWKGWPSLYRNGSPNQKKLGRSCGLWAGDPVAIELCCADLEDELATGLLGDEQLSATYDPLALAAVWARYEWALLRGHERLRRLAFEYLEAVHTVYDQLLVGRSIFATGKRCKVPTSPGRDATHAGAKGQPLREPKNLANNRQLHAPATVLRIQRMGERLPAPRRELLRGVRLRLPMVVERWSNGDWCAYYPSMTGKAGYDTPQPAVSYYRGMPHVARPTEHAVYCGELPVTVRRESRALVYSITGRVGRPDGPVQTFEGEIPIPNSPSQRFTIGGEA